MEIYNYIQNMSQSSREREIHDIDLSHGQAEWVLWHTLAGARELETAFDAYLKFLRREGMPFSAGELGKGRGQNVRYNYFHLMELAVALVLRQQSIPRSDLKRLLATRRKQLRPIYGLAYLEHDTEVGEPVSFQIEDDDPLRFGGVFLDLQLHHFAPGRISSGHPKLLGPAETIRTFTTRNILREFRPPIPLSEIATDIIRLAPEAPEYRRGRG